MENGKKISLQYRLKINKDIPAADQIQLAERRILKYIMLGKYDHFTNIMTYHIFVALAGKVARKPCHGDILDDIVSVNPSDRGTYGIGIQIRSKDLDIPSDSQLLHGLSKKNRNGIRFLAG